MKKGFLTLIVVFFAILGAQAQIENPVSWSYGYKKISATEGEIQIKATIDQGWHLYSQFLKPGGPSKTKISFNPSKSYALVGTTTEPKPITYYDKNFKMNVGYFADQVIFKQKIKLNAKTTTITGKVDFMVCDDTKCLPPDDVSFSIPIK